MKILQNAIAPVFRATILPRPVLKEKSFGQDRYIAICNK
jgi:hypothetical protein